jgi:hypothetical protein
MSGIPPLVEGDRVRFAPRVISEYGLSAEMRDTLRNCRGIAGAMSNGYITVIWDDRLTGTYHAEMILRATD